MSFVCRNFRFFNLQPSAVTSLPRLGTFLTRRNATADSVFRSAYIQRRPS